MNKLFESQKTDNITNNMKIFIKTGHDAKMDSFIQKLCMAITFFWFLYLVWIIVLCLIVR